MFLAAIYKLCALLVDWRSFGQEERHPLLRAVDVTSVLTL
jgi:hypothetical protein